MVESITIKKAFREWVRKDILPYYYQFDKWLGFLLFAVLIIIVASIACAVLSTTFNGEGSLELMFDYSYDFWGGMSFIAVILSDGLIFMEAAFIKQFAKLNLHLPKENQISPNLFNWVYWTTLFLGIFLLLDEFSLPSLIFPQDEFIYSLVLIVAVGYFGLIIAWVKNLKRKWCIINQPILSRCAVLWFWFFVLSIGFDIISLIINNFSEVASTVFGAIAGSLLSLMCFYYIRYLWNMIIVDYAKHLMYVKKKTSEFEPQYVVQCDETFNKYRVTIQNCVEENKEAESENK